MEELKKAIEKTVFQGKFLPSKKKENHFLKNGSRKITAPAGLKAN